MSVKKTPLNRIHKEAGARMVEFAGWEMPVQYRSALEEHHSVRRKAGIFDVSHMGQIELRGPDALSQVQWVSCNDAARLADGQAQYSAFLNPEGGFIDDIVVYRFSSERFLICVNAATTEKDLHWLQSNRKGRVEIVNRSAEYAQLAIQGPASEGILGRLTAADLPSIRFYWFVQGEVGGVPALISRTGYTGEPGFELYLAPEHAERVWMSLFEAGSGEGLTPAGLACRNSLRLEMRYPLYGTDIDDSTTPLESGLTWIVKFSKDFLGRAALERQKAEGVRRRLVGFELLDAGIARDGFAVMLDGEPVGKVTSGGFSPSLEKSIGLVYLPSDKAMVGQRLEIDVRGRMKAAQVVETPFYRKS